MKIPYAREKSKISKLLIYLSKFMVVIDLAYLLAFPRIKNHLQIFIGIFAICGILAIASAFANMTAEKFKKDRVDILDGGTKYKGTVLDVVNQNNEPIGTHDHITEHLSVTVFSNTQNKFITFRSPALEYEIEDLAGIGCNVYEMKKDNRFSRKGKNVLEEDDDSEYTMFVDSVDGDIQHKKKTILDFAIILAVCLIMIGVVVSFHVFF